MNHEKTVNEANDAGNTENRIGSGSPLCSPPFQPGDPIVVFMIDQTDARHQIERHGWYCGMKEDLHVYLLTLEDGQIAKLETQMVDMCHLNDLRKRRDEWSTLFDEGKSVKA